MRQSDEQVLLHLRQARRELLQAISALLKLEERETAALAIRLLNEHRLALLELEEALAERLTRRELR